MSFLLGLCVVVSFDFGCDDLIARQPVVDCSKPSPFGLLVGGRFTLDDSLAS